jgi:UDP-glucose 4-epimerase
VAAQVRTVLVTGGAGFIGANLCRALAEKPATRVTILDDLSTGSRDNLAGVDVELTEGSLLDLSVVDALVEDADVVVHLAARKSVPFSLVDPVSTHEVNATGTINVLEAARRIGDRHVVVASSSSVYGAHPALPTSEDQVTRPVSPYGASKLAGETYALAYAQSFSLPVLALRFFNVFGPLQPADHVYAAVVPRFVAAALAGRPLEVHGDGHQTRDFTFVDSVVDVLVGAVEGRVTCPEPVNLAFGTRTPLLDLVAEIGRLLGRPLEVGHTAPRPGDVPDSQADPTRLRGLFPQVEPVTLEAGLRATIAWFQADPGRFATPPA